MLGTGNVPAGRDNVANRGRPTREVAAEFLSKKLWIGVRHRRGAPPTDVRDAMRDALLTTDFDARPWVRAMLMHPDFYTDTVKAGLVRSPVEFVVALLAATGRRSADVERHSGSWRAWGNGRSSRRTSVGLEGERVLGQRQRR